MKIECPRCGQDYLVSATIRPLSEAIIVCPECEAYWTNLDEVGPNTFTNLVEHLEANGLNWDWGLLNVHGTVCSLG